VWVANQRPGTFADREEEADAGRQALQMLTRYAETHDLEARPRVREDWGRLVLPNGITLFGKIDRVDVADDGRVTVIDYKTGRRALPEAELPTNVAARIYTLAIRKRFPGAQLEFRLEYLALGRDISWVPDEQELTEALHELTDLTDEIHAREDFRATPGPACSFCPYAHICEDKDRVSLDDLVIAQPVPF
jgi:RecB family exonuclease